MHPPVYSNVFSEPPRVKHWLFEDIRERGGNGTQPKKAIANHRACRKLAKVKPLYSFRLALNTSTIEEYLTNLVLSSS